MSETFAPHRRGRPGGLLSRTKAVQESVTHAIRAVLTAAEHGEPEPWVT